MAFRTWIGMTLALLLAAAWMEPLAAQQAAPKIAVRDQVRVQVVGTELPTGPFVVDTDGAIDYPYVGRVKAQGLTARMRLPTLQPLSGGRRPAIWLGAGRPAAAG